MNKIDSFFTLLRVFFPLALLVSVALFRVYFEAGKPVENVLVEGVVWNHPYFEDTYQVIKVGETYVRTSWYPKYHIGDYLKVETGKTYYPHIYVNEEKSLKILRKLSSIRNWAIQRVKVALPEPHASLVLGMTLGYQGAYTEKFDQLLKDSGTMHIIVVSGYNVSLVAGFIGIIFAQWGRKMFGVFSIVCLILYLGIVGFDPPVLRAIIMGISAILALSKGENAKSLYVLAVTVCVLLIIHPAFLHNLSFLMSVTATTAVILASKITSGSGVIIRSLAVLILVNLAIFPITSFYFGRVSLVSPITNLLVLWIVPLVTIAGFVLIFVPILPITLIILVLLDYFILVISYFGSIEGLVYEYTLSIAQIVVYYFVLLWLAYFVDILLRRNRNV